MSVCVRALAHAVCVVCPVQMETEPVMASEPVFSVGPSVQVPCHIPAIPNGSGTQAKADERSGKLTAEQLAAIEDEELLDKMVLHTQVTNLDDLDLKAPLCDRQSSFRHEKSLCVILTSFVRVYLETSQPSVVCIHNAMLELHA